jgi:hypothetical protein
MVKWTSLPFWFCCQWLTSGGEDQLEHSFLPHQDRARVVLPQISSNNSPQVEFSDAFIPIRLARWWWLLVWVLWSDRLLRPFHTLCLCCPFARFLEYIPFSFFYSHVCREAWELFHGSVSSDKRWFLTMQPHLDWVSAVPCSRKVHFLFSHPLWNSCRLLFVL